MTILPSLDAAKKVGVVIGVILVAALVLGSAGWIISRFFPRHDPAPAIAAGKDTVKARDTGEAIGAATEQQNRDSTVHVDVTTKEIRDAFQAPPPAPAPGAPAADLPPAPVDRLRDALNAGIARANRAADDAGAAGRADQD